MHAIPEESEPSAEEGGGGRPWALQSELRAVRRLLCADHLRREADHPVVHALLELKARRLGALPYVGAGLHAALLLLAAAFSLADPQLFGDAHKRSLHEPPAVVENEHIPSLEDVFRLVCKNFKNDPFWFTVLGVILFTYGFILAVCRSFRRTEQSSKTFLVICFWYFNLLSIALRLVTNYMCLPSKSVGKIPAVLSCFIVVEELYQLPMFSYSLNLFQIVFKKSWKIVEPHCFVAIGILIMFYLINLILHTMNYDIGREKINVLSVPTVLANIFILVGEALDSKSRILAVQMFFAFVLLFFIMTINSMFSLAASNVEKIETKLAHRILHSRLSFIMENESMLISIHNALIRLPCMPSCIIRWFRSAVLFPPELSERICRITNNSPGSILIANMPSGFQCPLSFELSERIRKIDDKENFSENSSPDTVSPETLESELSDLEESIKDRLNRFQNDLKTFISKQNSVLEKSIKQLDKCYNPDSRKPQNDTESSKQNDREQFNDWQKQMRAYNSALAENINNSHANLESGIGRLEKTIGEMMAALDEAKSTS